MSYFISLLTLIASMLVLAVLSYATFYALPKGMLNRCGGFAVGYTEWLRSPNRWRRVLYWVIPAGVLFLGNWFAGIILLIAACIGVVFNRRFMHVTGLSSTQPD
jgi:hypothetical protein